MRKHVVRVIRKGDKEIEMNWYNNLSILQKITIH